MKVKSKLDDEWLTPDKKEERKEKTEPETKVMLEQKERKEKPEGPEPAKQRETIVPNHETSPELGLHEVDDGSKASQEPVQKKQQQQERRDRETDNAQLFPELAEQRETTIPDHETSPELEMPVADDGSRAEQDSDPGHPERAEGHPVETSIGTSEVR